MIEDAIITLFRKNQLPLIPLVFSQYILKCNLRSFSAEVRSDHEEQQLSDSGERHSADVL